MELEFYRQIFEKNSKYQFHQNPSSESQIVPYGRTDRQTNWCTEAERERETDSETDRQVDRQTDMKLPLAFCSFANEPKKQNAGGSHQKPPLAACFARMRGSRTE